MGGVNEVAITDGSTLNVAVDNALTLAPNNLEIDKGNLIINGTGFNPTGAAVKLLTLKDGNLTLNKPLGEKFKVKMTSGDLTVAGDGDIGNAGNGEVELEAKGRLLLGKDLKLKTLTTADGSQIDTGGKTLTVKPAAGLILNAAVTGALSLDISNNQKATLNNPLARLPQRHRLVLSWVSLVLT